MERQPIRFTAVVDFEIDPDEAVTALAMDTIEFNRWLRSKTHVSESYSDSTYNYKQLSEATGKHLVAVKVEERRLLC
jgi:hypothetical protein